MAPRILESGWRLSMNGKVFWRCAICLCWAALLMLLSPPRGSSAPPERTAYSLVDLDAQREPSVHFPFDFDLGHTAQLATSLGEALGRRLRQTGPAQEDEGAWTLSAPCDRAFRRRDLVVEGQLDTNPILVILRQERVDWLGVTLTHLRAAYGSRPPDTLRILLGLLATILLPVGLTLWIRRAALRAPDADRAAAWFGYWRFLQWMTLGTLLVWWIAADVLQVDQVTILVLNTLRPEGKLRDTAFLWFCVRFVPPALVNILCSTLSYPVSVRLHGARWTRWEVIRQAVWSQAAYLVPIALFLSGIDSLSVGAFRGSVLWFAAAWFSRIVISQRLVKALELAPHALTVGELRDHVFSLAEKAGVKLQQVYVLPAGKGRLANAFARMGNTILLTDYLLEHLSKREVDAVVAHELVHLKRRHPAAILGIFVIAILVATAIYSLAQGGAGSYRWTAVLPLLVLLTMLVLYFFRRRYERSADAGAVKLTADPEAMITALVKLAHLNLLPIHWGKWSEGWLTHPSTLRRAQAIARLGGIPAEKLQDLLSAPERAIEHYFLSPAVTGEGKVFSTTFKNKLTSRVSRTLLAAMTLLPALVARLARLGGWQGTVHWIVLLGGAAATFALFFILLNYLPLWGYGKLARRIQEKLAREGVRPEAWGGVFVGLAPDPNPRLYEHNWTWDVGFLFVAGDRLCYWGEEARFALRRDQVTSAGTAAGPPGWWRAESVYITWHDDRGSSGTFSLRPHNVRSLRQLGREVGVLGQRLRQWSEQPSGSDPLPSPLAELASPRMGQVSSISPRAVATPRRAISSFLFLAAVACGVCLLAGLHFGGQWALVLALSLFQKNRFPFGGHFDAGGWYVVLVTLSTGALQLWPYWRYRDPAR